jgi:Domain of unknown function (DUF5659)
MVKKILSINLASYLLAKGFKYEKTGVLENEGRKSLYLVFEETPEIAEAIKDYKNDKFLKEFGSNFKKLKTLFYQIRK